MRARIHLVGGLYFVVLSNYFLDIEIDIDVDIGIEMVNYTN